MRIRKEEQFIVCIAAIAVLRHKTVRIFNIKIMRDSVLLHHLTVPFKETIVFRLAKQDKAIGMLFQLLHPLLHQPVSFVKILQAKRFFRVFLYAENPSAISYKII